MLILALVPEVVHLVHFKSLCGIVDTRVMSRSGLFTPLAIKTLI